MTVSPHLARVAVLLALAPVACSRPPADGNSAPTDPVTLPARQVDPPPTKPTPHGPAAPPGEEPALVGKELYVLKDHARPVTGVAFSADGKTLTTSDDEAVRLWEAGTGKPLATIKTRFGERLAYSPAGNRLATAGNDELAGEGDERTLRAEIRVREGDTGKEVKVLPGHSNKQSGGRIHGLAFSPDGKKLASASRDGLVKVWDATTGAELASLRHTFVSAFGVAFSPDGKRLASSGDAGGVRVWDLATNKSVFTVPPDGKGPPVYGVAFSPDGKTLAASSSGPTPVTLYDAATGKEVLALQGYTGRVQAVAFSPDGRWVATGSGDWDQVLERFVGGSVLLWDAKTGKAAARLKGHTGEVFSVAFSPDGKRLASAGLDKTVRVWKVYE